jgi:hypothetical protein
MAFRDGTAQHELGAGRNLKLAHAAAYVSLNNSLGSFMIKLDRDSRFNSELEAESLNGSGTVTVAGSSGSESLSAPP